MEIVDLRGKTCEEGHSTLMVVSQRNDCFIVQCTTCGATCYEHDLKHKESNHERNKLEQDDLS